MATRRPLPLRLLPCALLSALVLCGPAAAWYKQAAFPGYRSVGRASGLLSGLRRSPFVRGAAREEPPPPPSRLPRTPALPWSLKTTVGALPDAMYPWPKSCKVQLGRVSTRKRSDVRSVPAALDLLCDRRATAASERLDAGAGVAGGGAQNAGGGALSNNIDWIASGGVFFFPLLQLTCIRNVVPNPSSCQPVFGHETTLKCRADVFLSPDDAACAALLFAF
ncbi:uncharacterized protein LOC127589333 [Hippocampus zosterae]|uniref:uncharacterized protein LOC127589333 n=1 Tax=Hippocampus zosterae TaxID=109293 RepID=UPI00223D765A|nr:uncharacterized protein LOC127589333 [Hippocampus zosterae]